MKKNNIIYWISTILVGAMMAFSGIQSVMHNPQGIQIIVQHLGYPEYFNTYLGVLKLAGAVFFIIPGFPRLKEWIYAAFTYDLVSAIYSFLAVGDPVKAVIPIFVFLVLLAVSYISYHKKLKAVNPGRL